MPVRITGGEFRGRYLPTITGNIRPTSARVRQALFDILGNIHNLSFCDLYAGTGAFGIEALSRGAGFVEFVESDRKAAQNIKKALDSFEINKDMNEIRIARVERWASFSNREFDIVFADPPYIEKIIDELRKISNKIFDRLSPAGIFILQLSNKIDPPDEYTDKRAFGDDILYFREKV